MRSFAISLLLLPAALTAASSRPSRMQTRGVLGKINPMRLQFNGLLQAQDLLEIQQKPFYNCPSSSQDGGARLIGSQSRIVDNEKSGAHVVHCKYASAGHKDMACHYDEQGALLAGDDGCSRKALSTTFAEAKADPKNFTCKIQCYGGILGRTWGVNMLSSTSYDHSYGKAPRGTNWIECIYDEPLIGSAQQCFYKSESGDLIEDKSDDECKSELVMAKSYCLRLPQAA